MVQCPVFGYTLTGKESYCAACLYRNIALSKGNEEEIRAIRELAAKYCKKGKSVKLFLQVYRNREEGGSVVSDPEKVFLADSDKLEPGTVTWLDEKFARQFQDCELQLFAEDAEGNSTGYRVKVENPEVTDFWQVGVEGVEDKTFRLVLGTQKNHSVSEPVTLA